MRWKGQRPADSPALARGAIPFHMMSGIEMQITMTDRAVVSSPRPRPFVNAAIAAVTVFGAAAMGNAVTIPAIPTWYAGLAKPWFNPPNWAFGPAWTILFLLMAIAFWRILERRTSRPAWRLALAIFIGQLVLNVLWSVTFFGLRDPASALVVVIALELAIVATIAAFRPIDRVAAWLLLPYAAWVGFATQLNIAIVWLN
jgi:tryptophan-rich sensory protein